MIPEISPDALDEHVLRASVYPRLSVTHHWTADWDPRFYVGLARAGFISIATHNRRLGAVLMPEIQAAYAVLDWADIHESTHVRKLRRSGRLEEEGVELRVSNDCHVVVDRIVEQHSPSCWLIAPYRDTVHELARQGAASGLEMHGIELWSTESGELIAGELGYTIGRIYTSLSGFCVPGRGRWNHFGSLQLVLLAERLRDAGYAFWNLGHPYMDYKLELGAVVRPRGEFLERWYAHRDEAPSRSLVDAQGPA